MTVIDKNGAAHDAQGKYTEQRQPAAMWDLGQGSDAEEFDYPNGLAGLRYVGSDGSAPVVDANGHAVLIPGEFQGFVRNLSEDGPDGYHADPRLSYSGMKHLLVNPQMYQYQRSVPHKPSSAMQLGTLVHAEILGTPVDDGFAVTDEYADFRSAAAKAWKAKQEDDGRIPITRAKYDEQQATIKAMTKAVAAHPEARRLLSLPGQPEVSFYASDPETGFGVRGRVDFLPDYVPGQRSVIVDVKTALDPTPDGFLKAVRERGYGIQAVHYADTIRGLRGENQQPEFVFVVVGNKAPHQVGVYRLDTRSLGAYRGQVRDAIDTWAQCESSGQWPGLSEETVTLSLSDWDVRRINESRATYADYED